MPRTTWKSGLSQHKFDFQDSTPEIVVELPEEEIGMFGAAFQDQATAHITSLVMSTIRPRQIRQAMMTFSGISMASPLPGPEQASSADASN